MTALLGAMAGILATWVLVALVLVGMAAPLVRGRAAGMRGVLDSFWLGYCLLVAYLQCWNFFLPVDAWAWLLPLGAAAAGARAGRALLGGLRVRLSKVHAVLLVLAVVWLLDQAAGECSQWDSGLYHWNSVRWAASYPVVPGLGNLHGRLAFNSSSFLVAAFLDVGPWSGRSSHLSNGLLLLGLLVEVFHAGARWRRSGRTPWDGFVLVLAFPWIRWVTTPPVSSLSTDVAPALLLFVAGARVLQVLESRERPRAFDLAWIACLGATAVCLKASALVYAAALGGTLAMFLALGRRLPGEPLRRALAGTAVFVLVLGASWVGRSYVLSGYPLYPLARGGLDVDWRVPEQKVRNEAHSITSHARIPGAGKESTKGFGWVGEWFRVRGSRQWRESLAPLGASLLALGILGATRRRRTGAGHGPWLLLPLGVALVLWFLQAPDPRFAPHVFWSLAAATVGLAVGRPGAPRAAGPALFLLLGAAVFPAPEDLWRAPGPDHGLWPTPVAEMADFTTDSGLVLRVPARGTQSWDAELPCTPVPRSNLLLRRPGDLGAGFRLGPEVEVRGEAQVLLAEGFEAPEPRWNLLRGAPGFRGPGRASAAAFHLDEDADFIAVDLRRIQGLVTVWMLDRADLRDGAARAIVDDGTRGAALGIDGSLSPDFYVFRTQGEWQVSGVPRSDGWHRLQWDYTGESALNLLIDGRLVGRARVRGGFKRIALGDRDADGVVTGVAFDDVLVESGLPLLFLEDFEEDLSQWRRGRGSPVLDAEAREGDGCLLLAGQGGELHRDLGAACLGTLGAWFHDGSFGDGYQAGIAAGRGPAEVWVGVDTRLDSGNYVVRSGPAGRIPRSHGWHYLLLDFREEEVCRCSVDGEELAAVPWTLGFEFVRVEVRAESSAEARFDSVAVHGVR